MADNRKLAQGLMMMTPSARADLAQREGDIQRGKTVELLRRAGQEMYDNPIVNTAIGFTPVLGDVQAAGETMASLNRGAPWQETAGYAAGMLPFVPMIGKTVWHGSPHSFDKFDLSKIGTGEGAQAYGHGLYLADAPEVAKEYQQKLSDSRFVSGSGKDLKDMPSSGGFAPMMNEMKMNGRTDEEIANTLRKISQGTHPYAKNAGKLADKLEAGKLSYKTGNLYKVDLPDEQIAKMLDWDKPLSEQNEYVQQAIRSQMPDTSWDVMKNRRGQDYYEHYWNAGIGGSGQNRWASQSLEDLGIPGIQYLDQASRGAGEGTRNYVVFSDEIPQILERNNQPVAQALREYKSLESLNPTGTVMTEYNPAERATLPLGKNLTTLDVTAGVSPDEMVEIYRGVPQGVSEISPGDFITTNRQLAQDYAGGGNVISQKVPYRTILDDLTEPLGEEYIYRP